MQIIKLEVENVKRLSAVSITPDGNLVIIGGKNGAGKSSVLDSIQYALAGGESLPEKPLKEGAADGFIELDLGEFIVTREFKRQSDGSVKSKVEIKNKEGFKKSSPQALLDSLYGKMTFDPLEFSKLKQKEQLEQLKALVGLDFSELDKDRNTWYDHRTDTNRKLKEKEVQIKSIEFKEAQESEISINNLMDKLYAIQQHNNERKIQEDQISSFKRLIEKQKFDIKETELEIMKLESKLNGYKDELRIWSEELELREEDFNRSSFIDESSTTEKIKNSETINSEIRRQAYRENLVEEYNALKYSHEDYSSKIIAIDNEKSDLLSNAKFPIPGMGFDENGVTMHGISFSQCSSAEKLKISVAMGIALNPKLKIMQIRDGSLLDEESLQLIDDMAKASDTQIWIELVGKRKECSVIIEDGYIQGDERFL